MKAALRGMSTYGGKRPKAGKWYQKAGEKEDEKQTKYCLKNLITKHYI